MWYGVSQEQGRLTRMDMRTRRPSVAVAFVSQWSPSVVVMIALLHGATLDRQPTRDAGN